MKYLGYVYIGDSDNSEVKWFNSIDDIIKFVDSFKEPVNVDVELNDVEIGSVYSVVCDDKTIVVDLALNSILLKGE